jgi:trehalose 6-phosphate synthase/phosphatase
MTKGKQKSTRRLVVVSNRLPFNVRVENEEFVFQPSAGGLVTGIAAALERIVHDNAPVDDYLWVGWPGSTIAEALQPKLSERTITQFNAVPVYLTELEMDQFYLGFCNKTIWPLFHYFPSYTVYEEEFWEQYKRVNERFAATLAEVIRPGDMVWVHDYHLMLLPQMLRARFPTYPIGFFLHIPFPSFEVFRLLPSTWRREILEGLVGADLVGFHTYEYTQHFLQCVLRILGYEHNMGQIVTPEWFVKADTFPMGIDFEKFADAVHSPEVQKEREAIKSSLQEVRVILSVDRLDYTKGILKRLEGFEILLHKHPRYHGKIKLIMIVVPSRIGVEHYDQMKKQIEEMVGKINGKFGRIDWTPVVYQHRHVPFPTLVAMYSLSDVALVTPLRDGMNLVAKEYIATREDHTGVLILSEMAGAAKELGEAIIINPNNREEIAGAMHEALEMPIEEQQKRNAVLQQRLRRYNVIRWVHDFLHELIAAAQTQERFAARLLSPTEKQKLVQAFTRSARRLLLFDYDGTLTPLVRKPSLAAPSAELLRLLAQLADHPANSLVLISGRDRDTLTQWFGQLTGTLVAEHGSWIRERGSDWKILKQQSSEWKSQIVPILQMYADRLPGAMVEEKDSAVAWHYRTADPEQAQRLAGELLDHLVAFTANIEIQVLRGHKVIEVKTAGITKGTAAQHIIERENPDFILSIGDDWTDEDVFGMLPEWAYSLRVGIANTRARFNLKNTRDVSRLLEALVKSSPAGILERSTTEGGMT